MDFLGFLQFCSEKAIHFTLVDDNLKLSAPPTTLTPNVVAQVRQWKPELVNWIKSSRSAAGAAAGTVPIGIVARGQLLPVSYGQEQLWLAGKLGAVGDGYHFVTVLALSGALDVPALQASFSAIVARHESLRTVFREQDGELFQQIVDAAPVPMGYSDLRGQDGAGQALQAEHLQQQLAAAPFDLATDLMLRLHLIRLDESEHRLVMVLHHIASDGWSLGVLAGELQTLYTGFVAGGPGADLAPLPVQYADYAHWLRATVQGKSLASSLDYWTRRLDGVPEVHQLPTDGQRPQQQRFQGLHYYSQFDLATL
ncbi:MAG: condensation domain-containing protein, partial [Telluria sp.]